MGCSCWGAASDDDDDEEDEGGAFAASDVTCCCMGIGIGTHGTAIIDSGCMRSGRGTASATGWCVVG